MHLPTDLSTWLKVVGALSVGVESILLAWRVNGDRGQGELKIQFTLTPMAQKPRRPLKSPFDGLY